MPSKMYDIRISSNNLGQIIDGIRCRARAYQITAEYYETGHINSDEQIEEVSDVDEAITLRDFYLGIIEDLEMQIKRQDFQVAEVDGYFKNMGQSVPEVVKHD